MMGEVEPMISTAEALVTTDKSKEKEVRYLIILSEENDLDVYRIKSAPGEVVEAVIALVHHGYAVPCTFSKNYWKETLVNHPLINELGKVMQINENHPCALCETYSEVAG